MPSRASVGRGVLQRRAVAVRGTAGEGLRRKTGRRGRPAGVCRQEAAPLRAAPLPAGVVSVADASRPRGWRDIVRPRRRNGERAARCHLSRHGRRRAFDMVRRCPASRASLCPLFRTTSPTVAPAQSRHPSRTATVACLRGGCCVTVPGLPCAVRPAFPMWVRHGHNPGDTIPIRHSRHVRSGGHRHVGRGGARGGFCEADRGSGTQAESTVPEAGTFTCRKDARAGERSHHRYRAPVDPSGRRGHHITCSSGYCGASRTQETWICRRSSWEPGGSGASGPFI